jgi:lysophospholipase L1-like esterase
VRNCGLARSKIADVSQLVSVIGQPRPRMVVLMCGVNNLGHGDGRDACVRDYEELLATVRAHLQPESILVLSVMPVRETPVDRAAQQFNMNIVQFNTELAECCRRHQIQFLDVNPAVTGANGGLADELTEDGLHLNAEGYRRLARIISPQLAALMHSP